MGGLWPATSGGRVRSLQTLSRLSMRHQVTVVTTHGPDDDPTGLYASSRTVAGSFPSLMRLPSLDLRHFSGSGCLMVLAISGRSLEVAAPSDA